MKLEVVTLSMFFALGLTGCGGNGDDWANQDPSAKALSPIGFDIEAAWSNFNLTPNSKEMTISGSCTGRLILSNKAASYIGTSTTLYNYSNVNRLYQTCNAPFASLTGASAYYDITNYYTLSDNRLKNFQYNYGTTINRWRTLPSFPTFAMVGDTGLIGVIDNCSSTCTLSNKLGVEEWSYIIEEDTASSVVFNLIVKAYNTTTSTTDTDYLSAPVVQTEQYRYVLEQDSPVLMLRTYDIEKATGFKLHAQ